MYMYYTFSFIHPAPGGAPQSVTAEAISPTVFTLRWQPPLMEDVNGVVTRYTVNVTELETGGGRVVEQFFTTETNVTVESRHPFYRYRYLVAAETSVGLGPFSDPNVIHMPEAGGLYTIAISCTMHASALSKLIKLIQSYSLSYY